MEQECKVECVPDSPEIAIKKSLGIKERINQLNLEMQNVEVMKGELNQEVKALGKDEGFKEYVKKKRQEDDEIIREIMDFVGKEELNIPLMRTKFVEVWKTVFAKIRSRTEELCTLDGGNKITIGQKGFGIREHVKSRPIEDMWGVKEILKISERVAKALEEKNLNNYAKYVRTFEKILPDFNSLEEGFVVEIPEVLLIQRDYEWSDEQTKKVSKIEVNTYSLTLEDSYEDLSSEDFINKDASPDAMLTYLQVRNNFQLIHDKLVEQLTPQIERTKKLQDELNTNFGKFLLLKQM